MRMNPLLATDFYKVGHIKQYPPSTTFVYSNFTCRSDKHAEMLPDFDHKVVFFGLQGVCNWLLCDLWGEEFFSRPKGAVVSVYRNTMDRTLGVGAVSTEHIAALHDLGYLPVRIKALPEGSRVDIRVSMWTIQNTHPDFAWVTNYLETQLSACVWKPITTATIAYEYRRLFDRYATVTGAPKEFVPWQGHDFSMRGMSGIFDAAMSGAGHLLSFTGTDTISAIEYLEDWYFDPLALPVYEPLIGGSVPASEHSVMTMGGEDNELETFRRLIQDVYPSGIVSVVSDSWDFWRVLTDYAMTLKDVIMSRDGKVVFRPDSGDPVKIICGDDSATPGSPEYKGAVGVLWDVFGGTYTDKGYAVLDSHVGLIYGDSITLSRANDILAGLVRKEFASSNIVFGIGSYTYQRVTRDTFGTAIKATFGVVDGQDRVIFKQPKTDDGVKNSARGLLRVEREGDKYVLYENQTREQEQKGLLETVFEDGSIMKHQTLTEIRARLATGG